MTRNCPKIHFNIVKNYVSAERKVIRHVINDIITNYTEPRGVDTTLDDFIRKINSILLRGVDISPNNFVRKINIIPPSESQTPPQTTLYVKLILYSHPRHRHSSHATLYKKQTSSIPTKKAVPPRNCPYFNFQYSIFQSTLLLSILQSQDL